MDSIDSIRAFIDFLIKMLPSIIVGLFLFYWQRLQKERDDKKDQKDELKEEAEDINREVNSATMELSYAAACALENGRPNGEVKKARKAYEAAKKREEEFSKKLQSQLINNTR